MNPTSPAKSRLGVLPIENVSFDEEAAVGAATLRSLTARVGLSLGDRACLALAPRLGRRALTADAA